MTTVIPAFGRDYKTAKDAKADWESGKDFIIQDMFSAFDGKPINKEQADDACMNIQIRFNRLTKITNA